MQQFSFFGLYTKKIWTIDYIYTAIWVVEKKLLLMLLVVQNFGNKLLSPQNIKTWQIAGAAEKWSQF